METDFTLEFLPGESFKTVSISILDDFFLEDEEILYLLLTTTDPQVDIINENVTLTIVDTDSKRSIVPKLKA